MHTTFDEPQVPVISEDEDELDEVADTEDEETDDDLPPEDEEPFQQRRTCAIKTIRKRVNTNGRRQVKKYV